MSTIDRTTLQTALTKAKAKVEVLEELLGIAPGAAPTLPAMPAPDVKPFTAFGLDTSGTAQEAIEQVRIIGAGGPQVVAVEQADAMTLK